MQKFDNDTRLMQPTPQSKSTASKQTQARLKLAMLVFAMTIGGLVATPAIADTYIRESPDMTPVSEIMRQLSDTAKRFAAKMKTTGKQRIVVAHYSDIYGRVSSLGRFVGEMLNSHLAHYGGEFEVIDRQHLAEVLKERKLQATSGLLNPRDAGRIGEFLGADVVIVGSTAVVGDNVYILSKGIDAKTGQIVFSDTLVLNKDISVDQMLRSGISGHDIFKNMPETARFHNPRTFTPDANTVMCQGYGTFRSEAHAKANYCYLRRNDQRSSLTCQRNSGDRKWFSWSRFCPNDDQGNRGLDAGLLAEMGISID